MSDTSATSAVPFFKPSLGEAEINEVVETLRSGWLTTGPRVGRFEQAFAEAVGARYAVMLSSGTAALHLAIEALGLRAGTGVLVPTMTFAATAEVVRYLGATPILVDCLPDTLQSRPDRCRSESGRPPGRHQGSSQSAWRPSSGWPRPVTRRDRAATASHGATFRTRSQLDRGGDRAPARRRSSDVASLAPASVQACHLTAQRFDVSPDFRPVILVRLFLVARRGESQIGLETSQCRGEVVEMVGEEPSIPEFGQC